MHNRCTALRMNLCMILCMNLRMNICMNRCMILCESYASKRHNVGSICIPTDKNIQTHKKLQHRTQILTQHLETHEQIMGKKRVMGVINMHNNKHNALHNIVFKQNLHTLMIL